MTSLNPYVWALYRSSFEGQQAVAYFEGLENYADNAAYELPLHAVGAWIAAQEEGTETPWEAVPMDQETLTYLNAVRAYAERHPVNTTEEVQALLTGLVTSGQVQLSDDPEDVLDLDVALNDIGLVTLALHLAHPEVFVPYAFPGQHDLLLRISATFEIPLPPVAGKKEHLERWLSYGHFSAAYQAFRWTHDLTVPELLAFLNDFAVTYVLTGLDPELPEPRNAWLLVGGGDKDGDFGWLEEATGASQTHWQGNLDMRRGDVCVMYVRSPVAAVHSLCRVVEDAYEDPFFHYKHAVQIGDFQRVPRVPFRELAADPVMAQSQHIRRNLQGTSGQVLSRAEYGAILDLLAEKGFDRELAPRLPEQAEVDLSQLGNERDVENLLVKPLLERLGLGGDWVQQLTVRMGRGEKVYPDFALGVTGTYPEQRVRALVEVKYRAPGERAWREAFVQAKSYAMRLGARSFLVAAAEGVRLYPRAGEDFSFETGQPYAWDDLHEGRALLEMGQALR